MNFYNEHDPKAAAWLRGLIEAGEIPAGVVDERSIEDITPQELAGYTQCHFFAGIGGWSFALRLAGWPDDRPVWTGSCPCQPFSTAGEGAGIADERHLWPAFYWLIRQCQPPIVFGEQVASSLGREWLAGIRVDLEDVAYEVGASDLCSAGVGSPNIRQRLYWMADSECDARGARRIADESCESLGAKTAGSSAQSGRCGLLGGGMDDTTGSRFNRTQQQAEGKARDETRLCLPQFGCGENFWSDSRLILCRDGKHRRIPTEPALFPLADGLPYKLARRGSVLPALLRGSGNAINPHIAAEFIGAFLDLEKKKGGAA